MEGKRQKQASVRELSELSKSETRDGVLVRVRCVEISQPRKGGEAASAEGERSVRYEIYMEARGHTAVADMPGGEAANLASRVDEIVGAFVDSVRLQGRGAAPS